MAIQANINFLQDNAGTPGAALSNLTLNTGSTFFVEIQLGDFRTDASGLVGSQLDLTWTANLFNALSYTITSSFAFLPGGDVNTDGLANNLRGGAIAGVSGQAIGINQFERFAVVRLQVEADNTTLTPSLFTIGDVSPSNFAIADGASVTVTANDDSFVTDETTPLAGSLFGNDVTGGGGQIIAINGSSANIGQAITLASGSTVTVNADGSFSYNPIAGSAGSQDTFTYRLSVFGSSLQPTSTSTTDDATVTVTIAAPPTDIALTPSTIAENSAANSLIGTLSSVDSDSSTFTYTLVAGDGSTDNGNFTVAGNQLFLTPSPNFETQSSYSIRVRTTDPTNLFFEETLTIAVTDEDEFDVTTPTDADNAENTIAEDAIISSVVGITANATDADGSNNTVTYSLTDDAGGRFAINANTGVVTVASALDFETATSHNITVQATSSDTSTATQTFTIAVSDVDEFDVTTPTDTDAGANTIAEDETVGATVGITANATDADGSNNTVTYSLTDDAGGRFTINASTGIVTVASALDFETATSHNITVQATSADTSTATQTFTIAVTDEDEFDVTTPTDADNAENTIAEDAIISSVVGITANATDADGSNNTVTYSLTDDAGGRFAINANTGVVTVASALDFETATSHNITVQATSSDTSTATQTFTIAVSDVDEFDVTTPTDTDAGANTIAENATNASTVGITASATDADGSNNTVTYSLTDDADGRFTIDSNTGVITVADGSLLDYETATSHDITVQATSSDTSTATQTFTIAVTDVISSSVTAISDTNTVANSIAEDSANGSPVGITAFADDEDTTDTVTYSLTDDAGGRFTIDANTGVVTVAGALNYETATSHNITVQAASTDGSTSTETFTIAVTDEDEFDVTTPTDTNAAANTIAEDETVGATVGITANAIDADGSNNTVTYSLTDDAGGRFTIDANTGVVTVAGALDYETATSHNITVQAASTDGSTSTETFTIAVTDVNEAPTAVALNNQVSTIAENTDTTTRIKVADIAVTNDALGTETIALSGADAASFEIEGTELYLKAGVTLDFETQSTYAVTVEVDDTTVGATPDVNTNFTLTVTDVNEAPTIVALNNQTSTIAENTDTTTRIKVADIAVTDDALGTETIALSGADAASFEIEGTELYLKAGVTLDFETQSTYAVTVEVDDTTVGATPDVSTNFTLTVTDVNEAPTIVAPTNFDVEFAENSTAIVLDIDAEDPENDAINFALVGADAALFTISALGQITFDPLKPSPDFENPQDQGGDNIYNVTVEVSDGTNPTVTQDITIEVTNVNEAPIAVDDTASLDLQDASSVIIRPLENDSDPEGDSLTITSAASTNGTVTIDGETLLYAPQAGFTGTDSFSYTISDGENEVTGNVTVTVTDAPEDLALIPNVDTPDTDIETGVIFDPIVNGNGKVILAASRASNNIRVPNVSNGTDAVFDNLIGLYEVLDATGGIDTDGDGTADVNPGDPGYALAALEARVDNFTLRAGAGLRTAQRLEQTGDALLNGGRFYAPFIIANGGSLGVQGFIDAETAETDGVFNDAAATISEAGKAIAYFSFSAANPDGLAHLRAYGNGVYGFEDLPGGIGISDNDFNDAVFALDLV